MQFLLPLLYIILFGFFILRLKFFNLASVSKVQLLLLFGLKLIASAAVWLIYTHYYKESDFLTSFSDSTSFVNNLLGKESKEMSSSFSGSFENVLFNSSRLMVYLNIVLHLFSFGNYYVHGVFFCFFSFAGLVALMKAFLLHFPQKQKAIVIALFFIPSILFWGSSALKDSVALGLTGLLVYFTDFGLNKKYSFSQGSLIVCLLIFLFFLRLYVFIAIIPVLVSNMFVARTTSRFIWLKYLIVFIATGLLCFFVALIQPDYNVFRIVANRQAKAISEAKGGAFLYSWKNFISVEYDKQDQTIRRQADGTYRIIPGSAYLSWSLNNMEDTTFVNNSTDTAVFHELYTVVPLHSAISLKRIKPQPFDFFMNSPSAFMNTLTHPHFFEVTSWLHLLMAIENMWILLVITLALFFFDRALLKKKEVLLFCFVFGSILFVLIGLTTPAIGAMVRYRIVALVFLMAIALMAIDQEKFRNKLLKLKKQ